jgi:ADP-heptose:LPS heptosyltransferase
MIKKFNDKKLKYGRMVDSFLKIIYFKNTIAKNKKTNLKINKDEIKSVLVFEFGLIGDIIMVVPALKAIRKNLPNAKITLVCGAWGKVILEDQGLVDEFKIFNCPWLNKDYSLKNVINVLKSLKLIRKDNYDIGLDFRGDIRDILFLYYSKCKERMSYDYTGGEYLLTNVITPDDKVEHLIDNNMYLLETIGLPYDNKIPVMTWKKNHDEIRNENKIVLGIHPGSSKERKVWFEENYSELIKLLLSNKQFKILLFEGPGEGKIVNNIINSLDNNEKQKVQVIKTDIRDYISFLNSCDIVLCNDSGAGHIAGSLNKKVVVLFGPTEPELGVPYGKCVRVISKKLACKPCSGNICDNDKKCFRLIGTDEVYKNILDICNC